MRGCANAWASTRCTGPGVRESAWNATSRSSASRSRARCEVASWIFCSRATGSGSSHGSSRNTNEMRLPSSASSAPRTSAGTITLRRCGPAKLRSAPAQVASTTSLGVTPKRRRSARTSSSERVTRTWWRRGVPGRLSAVAGAGGSSVCESVRAPRAATPGSAGSRPASRTGASTSEAPSAARSATARARRPSAEGAGVGPRGGVRPPGWAVAGVGLGVEDQLGEVGDGDAVDHAVVGLADHRDPALGQLVGEPELPQRPVARQRRGEDLVDERVEVVALRVQQVLGGVEVGVVDPHRLVQPERHRRELLPVARREREPRGEVLEQLREAGRRAVLGRLERRHPADVHRRVVALDGEEGGVQRRQPLAAHDRLEQRLPVVVREARRLGRLAEVGEHGGEVVGLALLGHVARVLEDLEAAAGHRLVGGLAVGDGDDRVALAPHDQRRQQRGERQPVVGADALAARLDDGSHGVQERPAGRRRCRARRSRGRARRCRGPAAGRGGRAARRPRGRAPTSLREVSAGST